MGRASDPWTLREATFEERIHRFLLQALAESGFVWIGILDSYFAPNGDLAAHWLAAAPDVPVDDLAPDVLDQLIRGEVEPELVDLRAPYWAVRRIELASDLCTPHPVLLVASERSLESETMDRLLTALTAGITSWRRRQLADRLYAAVEQMPDPFELTDRNGRLSYANRAWQEAFGHDRQTCLGNTVARVFRGRERPLHDTAFYKFTMDRIQDGSSWLGALACRTASGESRFAEAHVGPFDAPGFLGNVAIRRDLRHRERRDLALAQAHNEFRRVLTALPDGAAVLRDERIYFANPAFLRMTDRRESEVVGSSYPELVHPDDRPLFLDRDVNKSVRVRMLRPNGEVRVADISTPGSLSFEGQPALILMSRDVTDDRLAAETLARAERLSALGALAAGLAHEINNPLAYLTLSLYGLRDQAAHVLDDAGRETLGEAVDGAERIQRIVKELRAFSGQDSTESDEVVDVAQVAASALNIAQNEIRHRATLFRNLASGAWVMAREGPLVQVLVSLLINAAQATPEGDTRSNTIGVDVAVAGDEVVVTVADTGIGIPRAHMARVFEPFFTSKARMEGSGLGLSIARRIVEGFGGRITLESEEWVGTTATVVLPKAAAPRTDAPASTSLPKLNHYRARILIVDDEVQITRAITRVLRGYEIVTAEGWEAAMDALETQEAFDVVLCDLMMPGRSGPQLYQEAIVRCPKLRNRFLFMTGGAFADGVPRFLETWRLPVVAKPFDPDELNAIIQDVVRGRYDDPNA